MKGRNNDKTIFLLLWPTKVHVLVRLLYYHIHLRALCITDRHDIHAAVVGSGSTLQRKQIYRIHTHTWCLYVHNITYKMTFHVFFRFLAKLLTLYRWENTHQFKNLVFFVKISLVFLYLYNNLNCQMILVICVLLLLCTELSQF